MFKLKRILLVLSSVLLTIKAEEVINNIVVFGDSYSDVGNRQKLTNGPLWSEHLAVGWEASLYSFAFSGAVCDNELYSKEAVFIPSIVDQIEMFYKQNLDLNMNETAVILWIGVNDIYKIFEKSHTGKNTIQQDLTKVVECISTNIRNVRRVFSANKFIVFGVPPLERMPYYANTELSASREKAANDLNYQLTKEVEKMNKHIQSLELDLVDIHRLLDDIADQPELFNIINTEDPYWNVCQGKCNDDIDSYVWWDKTHLTGGIHRLIANSILLAGSLAPETYLKEDTDVSKLIATYKSPIYKPVRNTGEINRIIQKLTEEEQQKQQQQQEQQQQEVENEFNQDTESTNQIKDRHYLFYGITLIVILSIGFLLFINSKKRRTSNLSALNNLLKDNSRGRFVPLRNLDNQV